jgi:hypothetical protein
MESKRRRKRKKAQDSTQIMDIQGGIINLDQVPSIQKYTGEMESERRWKAKGDGKQRKRKTQLKSWISKVVSSIKGPIDPKVYWLDGKGKEMESQRRWQGKGDGKQRKPKASTRMVNLQGGIINLDQVPSIQKYTG